MKKISHIILILFFALTSGSAAWADPDAAAVVRLMDSREDGDTQVMDTLMVLMDRNNDKRTRNIRNIRKDAGPDSRRMIFFLSPADVRNTAYMAFDFDDPDKEDDSFLYLPSLQKVKRVAAGDKSGSFMGSDFTYSDINGITVEHWDWAFAQGEVPEVDGTVTWVVEGLPKAAVKDKVLEETGYLKTVMWISKESHMLLKAKYWVKEGQKIKFFKASDIRKIDGIPTAHEMAMVTTVKGKVEHSSLLRFSNVRYNVPVSDDTFTTRRMEQGL